MRELIGLIPARGGSKGIAWKNLREIDGRSLTQRTARVASTSDLPDVYVYTDDRRIMVEGWKGGAQPVHRPAEVSGDKVTTEATVARFLRDHDRGREVKAVMVLQATSPFLRTRHINEALRKWRTGEFDSVVGAFVNERFHGNLAEAPAEFEAVWPERAMRQDLDMQTCRWTETGSLYLATRELWEAGRRIGDRCGVVVHHFWEGVEIDEPIDLLIARAIQPVIDDAEHEGTLCIQN